MTFGEIKTQIENRLIETYKNQKDFKRTLKEFKFDILNNKNIAKVYSLYDELSSPQGLNENDAYLFITEGISLIQKHLKNVKLPTSSNTKLQNNYKLIDDLVYSDGSTTLKESFEEKKVLSKTICQQKKQIKESLQIPVSTMIKVANQSLNKFVENLDEATKKEFLEIIKEDTDFLKIKFDTLKSEAKAKLKILLDKEVEIQTKSKITETMDRIQSEKFDYINYVKLRQLVESL
jgi:hypothetical protein